MFWTFSFQLMSGEEIVEDARPSPKGLVKSAYAVFLTNKRVVLRFQSLGSNLTQSFLFEEIEDAYPQKRVFVTYLALKTYKRTYYFHVGDVEYWAGRIVEFRGQVEGPADSMPGSTQPMESRQDQELLAMLTKLRESGLLTEEEFEAKRQLLETSPPP